MFKDILFYIYKKRKKKFKLRSQSWRKKSKF